MAFTLHETLEPRVALTNIDITCCSHVVETVQEAWAHAWFAYHVRNCITNEASSYISTFYHIESVEWC